MDPGELLKLLDLNPSRAGPTTGPALSLSGPDVPSTPASPTALKIDEWGLRRGRNLLAESERLQGFGLDGFAVADCHAAAFDPEPRLAADCQDPARRAFFAALLSSPEHAALHASTRLDPLSSEIAALHFAEQLAQVSKEAAGLTDEVSREVAALRAAGRAVAAADAEVHECREAAQAFGMGPGAPGSNDPKAIAELFRLVRGSSDLARICVLAGRFRRLAQSRQRRKVRHGLDDVVGVELSGELARTLPYELGKLVVPELELDTLRRLAEGQLLSREHHATEPVAKGPILVCVDESGSMYGEPVHMAKALALALAWIARPWWRTAAIPANACWRCRRDAGTSEPSPSGCAPSWARAARSTFPSARCRATTSTFIETEPQFQMMRA